MTCEEMMYELKMCGFGQATLRCFALAHESGASVEELEELYKDLMAE